VSRTSHEVSKKGPLQSWLEYVPIRAIQGILGILPRRWALSVGRGLGLAAYVLDRRHRKVALENIAQGLPEGADPADRRRIARASFAHFGAVAVECLLLPYRRLEDVDSLAQWEGVEHLTNAHMRGKGVFVVSGHLGNWEVVALLQGWLGWPMAMVTRPLDNPLLERLFAAGRNRSGNEIIHKRRAVRKILKALRQGWCVAIVIDQDFPESDRVFVDFLGRPAAAAPTLGLLALRTGAPIVPVVSHLLPDGRYRIEYLSPVEVKPTGDREADVLGIMSRCTALLEEAIRRHPEQWLWMHRRWKTRPRKELPGDTGEERPRCQQKGEGPSSSIETARSSTK
jgi:KDO2-lipid IV(A) lauroyltransferase